MPRQCYKPFDREQLDRELQAMLINDCVAVLHGLHCQVCDSRALVLQSLALAGWSEEEYLRALEIESDGDRYGEA